MTPRLASRRALTVLVVTVVALASVAGVALGAFTNTTRLDGTATADYVAPTLLLVPHVSGTPADGETLTALPAVWAGLSPVATRAYQWYSCSLTLTGCAAISGATSATYVVPIGGVDANRYAVQETVTNGTRSATAVSIPTEKQTPGSVLGLFKFITVTTAMPAITGGTTVGATLTSSAGTWTSRSLLGALLGTISSADAYQWFRCGAVGNAATPTVGTAGCTAISGATSASRPTVAADVGSRLRVQVTHSASITVTVAGLPVALQFVGVVDTQATGVITS